MLDTMKITEDVLERAGPDKKKVPKTCEGHESDTLILKYVTVTIV